MKILINGIGIGFTLSLNGSSSPNIGLVWSGINIYNSIQGDLMITHIMVGLRVFWEISGDDRGITPLINRVGVEDVKENYVLLPLVN